MTASRMMTGVLILGNLLALLSSQYVSADEPDVEALWEQWQSGDRKALFALEELGPESRSLANRLFSSGSELSGLSADEKWLLREMQADAVPSLLRVYHDGGKEDRLWIINHLASLGSMARPAAEKLVDIAIGSDEGERNAALRALAKIQVKQDFLTPELMRMLALSRPSNKARAVPYPPSDYQAYLAAILLTDFPDRRAEYALLRAMESHPEADVRSQACRALVATFSLDSSVLNLLVRTLDDDEATPLSYPVDSVASISVDLMLTYEEIPAEISSVLIQKLYRESFEAPSLNVLDLCEAICRCRTTDPQARALVDHKLRELLDDDAYFHPNSDRVWLQVAAASVILYWDPTDREAADFLVSIADETERLHEFVPHSKAVGGVPDVRAHAVRGLGRVGEASRDWLPMLHAIYDREMSQNPTSELAFETAWAIAQIDPDDVKCIKRLSSAKWEILDVREISWTKIEKVLGKRTSLLVPDLDEALGLFTDPEFVLYPSRWMDNWELMCLRPHAKAILPLLKEHAESDQIQVRIATAEILGTLATSSDNAVSILIDLLSDPRAVVRMKAAQSLKEIGPGAVNAVTFLEKTTNDEYLSVAIAAEDALVAIKPKPDDSLDD